MMAALNDYVPVLTSLVAAKADMNIQNNVVRSTGYPFPRGLAGVWEGWEWTREDLGTKGPRGQVRLPSKC